MSQAVDPVCGMTVDPKTAAAKYEYAGQMYYFCNPGCKEKFKANPKKYLNKDNSDQEKMEPPRKGVFYVCPMDPEVREPKPGPCPKCGMALEPEIIREEDESHTEYTCPMHPEVISDKPGTCPKCGMALEPKEVSAKKESNPELDDMTRRFNSSFWLTCVVFYINMIGMFRSDTSPGILSPKADLWIQMILTTFVVYWAKPFFVRGMNSIIHKSLNMFTLIALGTGVAYIYSLIATFVPGIFPDSFKSHNGHVAVYFESAAVIITLVLMGQVLELRAREKTSGAIKALMGLKPKTARIVSSDGVEKDIPLKDVKAGDILRVRPGGRVPVDGVITEGSSSIDESMITGESMPALKQKSDRVIGGTMNWGGSFLMKAEQVGQETVLSQIVRMVGAAQRSRAPIHRLADKVSAWFVPIVISISAITFIIWGFFGPEPRMAYAIVNAVAVLIIACPCALGLATPMSIMVGTGRGATAGVLFKNAEALEILEKVDTLVIDKTGTLTEGKPSLISIIPGPDYDEASILKYSASLEMSSEHPLAQAILDGALKRDIKPERVDDFKSHTGKGVTGTLDNHRITIGNQDLFKELGIDLGWTLEKAEKLREDGQSVMFLAIDGKPAGILGVSDPIKKTTPQAIEELKKEGVRVIILTGDNKTTAWR
jgi:Cu+-exporting ATPase